MAIDGFFELLTRVIQLAQRDARSKDPYKRLEAQMFLQDFLRGVDSDGF